jgi:hypothetical protein
LAFGTSAIAAEVVAGLPVQSLFVNQSILTVPVGTGLPATPVTVTKSCTIEPSGTVVTALCVALWIVVAVVDVNCVITDCEAAPTSGGFGLQLELPVPAGSLHRSCHPRFALSVRLCPGSAKSAACTV